MDWGHSKQTFGEIVYAYVESTYRPKDGEGAIPTAKTSTQL